jgi:hypothetical protein
MKIKFKFVFFIAIFLLVYLGLHFFVLNNLFTLFSFQKNVLFYLLIIILALAYPLAMVIERYSPNRISRGFYAISATWLGFMSLLFFTLIIYLVLSVFFVFPKPLIGEIIISLVLLLTIYGIINASIIRITKIISLSRI